MICKRLLPLVMVLVVGAAPLALELCQVECRAPGPEAAGHSCHEEAAAPAPGNLQQVASMPHVCGHEGSLPALSQASGFVVAPAVTTQVATSDVYSAPLRTSHAAQLTRVPIPPILQAPLRL